MKLTNVLKVSARLKSKNAGSSIQNVQTVAHNTEKESIELQNVVNTLGRNSFQLRNAGNSIQNVSNPESQKNSPNAKKNPQTISHPLYFGSCISTFPTTVIKCQRTRSCQLIPCSSSWRCMFTRIVSAKRLVMATGPLSKIQFGWLMHIPPVNVCDRFQRSIRKSFHEPKRVSGHW